MANSVNFARIKRQVLEIVVHIDKGNVATTADIGEALDVPSRHVAYILASLNEYEREVSAWHRVVGRNGVVGKGKHRADQLARLQADGVTCDPFGAVQSFKERLVPVQHSWFTGPTLPEAELT